MIRAVLTYRYPRLHPRPVTGRDTYHALVYYSSERTMSSTQGRAYCNNQHMAPPTAYMGHCYQYVAPTEYSSTPSAWSEASDSQ